MQIVADLHLHSRYSRAVSQKMNLQENAAWAKKKGINLLATADWTHPVWLKEISATLKKTRNGIYFLDDEPDIAFLLSTEVSCIYSQGGKLRRIHLLIFSPSISTCEKVVAALEKRGAKLMSDGRPILGISAKDLLQMLLEIDEKILLIPAHAWTPWFSLYGSFSGFDSIDECFGDLEKYIYGVETGLSSDPLMNWQIKELENRSIVSFSDAHSSPKLGREATIFVPAHKTAEAIEYTFADISDAIKQEPRANWKIGYTIEFFPEEGKYHWSGHRNCEIRYSPKEIKEKGKICPVCKRPLTIGVENRVIDLAHKYFDEADTKKIKNTVGTTYVYDSEKKRPPFVSLVPLLEILLELSNNSPTKAAREYERVVMMLGTEFEILMKKTYEEIESVGGEKLKQAIQIMRERTLFVDPGFDGVFGKVTIFKEEQSAHEATKKENSTDQLGLF